ATRWISRGNLARGGRCCSLPSITNCSAPGARLSAMTRSRQRETTSRTERAVVCDRAHWEGSYAQRAPDQVSWYEPLPERSLELIQATGLGHDASILDVGGGASSLAAELLAMGYTDLTVADISPTALAHA